MGDAAAIFLIGDSSMPKRSMISSLRVSSWTSRRWSMKAVEALALVGGHVDEELLKRNESLAAENEILRSKVTGRIRFTDTERIRLATLGHELGRKALEGVAAIVKPETRIRAMKFPLHFPAITTTKPLPSPPASVAAVQPG
jgi:hypothetical protein